jgi:hypothetical protein
VSALPATPFPDRKTLLTATVDSTSDNRTVNNAMRHQYRVLSDAEKAQVQALKDKGAEFYALIESLYPRHEVGEPRSDGMSLTLIEASRELQLAQERVEEAVMWAVKHVTR